MSLVKLITTALAIFNSSFILQNEDICPAFVGITSVTNCDPTSHFTYLNGAITPSSPQLYENFTLEVGYSNNYKVVNGGIVDYTINFNGLPYLYSEPLCSNNLPCPIELGDHIVSSNPISLNQIGKLLMTQKWTSDIGDVLLCTKTTISIAQNEGKSDRNLRG
jgi:hypothetical protein